MDWFKCDNCAGVCNETTVNTRPESETSEHFGQVAITTTYFQICPDCGSDELRDFTPCSNCVEVGKDFPAEPVFGCDFCLPCALEVLDLEEYVELCNYESDDRDAAIMNRLVRGQKFRTPLAAVAIAEFGDDASDWIQRAELGELGGQQ